MRDQNLSEIQKTRFCDYLRSLPAELEDNPCCASNLPSDATEGVRKLFETNGQGCPMSG